MISSPPNWRFALSVLLLVSALTSCSDSGSNDPVTNDATAGNQTNADSGNQNTSGSSDANTSGSQNGGDAGNNDTGGETDSSNNQETTTSGADTAGTGNGDGGSSENPDSNATAGSTTGNTDPEPTNVDSGNSDSGSSDGESPEQLDTSNEGESNDTVVPVGPSNSGGDDDSLTTTESLSLIGPFVKDPNRAAGPPSVPYGLTLLMAGENFVEFSWVPSTDDQSVEAYEIYRDGTLVFTLRGDTNYEFDYRSWITTSYIDCNYTRYTFCNDNPITPGSSYEYRVIAVDNEGMKSAPSAPATFQMAQRQSSPVNLSGYNQVFADEFNGSSLDRAQWKTSLPWGPNTIINGEKQYFVNIFGSDPLPVNPFSFNGTTLKITGSRTPNDLLSRANNQPYLSGVISTSDYFEMTYGYVEMSAKLTGGTGFLSTFYLFNQEFDTNKPEIDIIEYIGDRPDKAYQTYHYFDSNRSRWATGERHSTPTMETNSGTNYSSGFHTYSVLWEPGLVVWYIDGTEVRRLTGIRVSNEPMNIIAQLVVGSEWIGEPDPASLPKTLEIDYIRAWQKP